MSIIQGTGRGGARGFYDFPIENSLRFDGSSYLSRTPSTAGNRKTWTWSGWVKLGNFGVSTALYAAGAATASQFRIFRSSSDKFELYWYAGGNYSITPTQVIRDVSAWYHLVVSFDTTQATNSDMAKLYINGNQITDFSTTNYPTQNYNTEVGNASIQTVGRRSYADDQYFDGYLANVQFIDGQALDQYFFGEFKDNIWVPYNAFSTAGSGTATASDGDTATDSYGTNGFHLDFADSSNIGNDVSGNNNDWTVN